MNLFALSDRTKWLAERFLALRPTQSDHRMLDSSLWTSRIDLGMNVFSLSDRPNRLSERFLALRPTQSDHRMLDSSLRTSRNDLWMTIVSVFTAMKSIIDGWLCFSVVSGWRSGGEARGGNSNGTQYSTVVRGSRVILGNWNFNGASAGRWASSKWSQWE